MYSPRRTNALACYALSPSALPLAQSLAAALEANPWGLPSVTQPGMNTAGVRPAALSRMELFAPARFCPAGANCFDKIGPLLATTYKAFAAHAFIGATGIAVRALAPLLSHKSTDAPVLVLDTAGQYVISLLSGHWGGANELARHLASLLGATAVITTASDAADSAQQADSAGNMANQGANPGSNQGPGKSSGQKSAQALDLLLRNAGLQPVDWDRLPAAQAAMLEGTRLNLWDPCRAVPNHPLLRRLSAVNADAQPPTKNGLLVAAHWRRLAPHPTTLRVAVPRLVIGLGCRKNAPGPLVETATRNLLAAQGLEPLAVAALATVKEKLQEPALMALAERMHVPLLGFDAAELAQHTTPNPSDAAGRLFYQPPFSVCEASALLASAQIFSAGAPRLLVPKIKEQGQLTLAIAVSDRKS